MTKRPSIYALGVVAAVVFSSCEARERGTQDYESEKALIADLEEADRAWDCYTNLAGYIAHPDEIGVAQCRLQDETGTAHVLDPAADLPSLEKTDNGPYTWWVSGENWLVATGSEELAEEIQTALGGEITTSRL